MIKNCSTKKPVTSLFSAKTDLSICRNAYEFFHFLLVDLVDSKKNLNLYVFGQIDKSVLAEKKKLGYRFFVWVLLEPCELTDRLDRAKSLGHDLLGVASFFTFKTSFYRRSCSFLFIWWQVSQMQIILHILLRGSCHRFQCSSQEQVCLQPCSIMELRSNV